MKNKTIQEIIEENPSRAMLLDNHGIVYQQYLDTTLQDLCDEKNINCKKLAQELTALGRQEFNINFNLVSIPFLIEYLINTHHEYAKTKLPAIRRMIAQLSRTDENYRGLEKCYRKFSNQMRKHIILEEELVFPFILQMQGLYEKFNKTEAKKVFSKYSVEVLCHNHEHDEDEMEELKAKTNNFKVEQGQPFDYRIIMHELKQLDRDMNQHAAIEDNVLFKKAAQMETILKNKLES